MDTFFYYFFNGLGKFYDLCNVQKLLLYFTVFVSDFIIKIIVTLFIITNKKIYIIY